MRVRLKRTGCLGTAWDFSKGLGWVFVHFDDGARMNVPVWDLIFRVPCGRRVIP